MKAACAIFSALAVLALAAAPALAGQAAAGGATTLPEQAPALAEKAGGFAGSLAGLAAALVPLALVVAGVVLMFSARAGKKLLLYILAGAFLALGGWKIVLDLIRCILAGW